MLQIDDKKSKQLEIERLLAKARLKDEEDKVLNQVRLYQKRKFYNFDWTEDYD